MADGMPKDMPSTSSSSSTVLTAVKFPKVAIYCESNPQTHLQVYLAVSAGVFFSSVNEHEPKTLPEFSGKGLLRVERLPDDRDPCTNRTAVSDALRPVAHSDLPKKLCCGFGLRVKCTRYQGGVHKKSGPEFWVLVASNETMRNSWMEVLRISIAPISLLRETFDFRHVPNDTPWVAARNQCAWMREFSDQANDSLRHLTIATRGLNWFGGIFAVASEVSATSDVVGIALGCVPAAGLFFQVVSLGLKCAANLDMAARDERRLVGLWNRLVLASKRIAAIAIVISQKGDAAFGEEDTHIFKCDLIIALAACWDVMAKVEQHAMKKLMARAWSVADMDDFGRDVDVVERVAKHLDLVRVLCNQDSKFRECLETLEKRVLEDVQSWYASVNSRLEYMELSRGSEDSDTYSPSYDTVPTVSGSIVPNAVPLLESVTACVLSNGSVGVTDSSGADQSTSLLDGFKASGPGAPTALYGEGGIGKTTACQLIANDPAVQISFPGGVYYLSLETSFDVVKAASAIAHILDISGGRFLAARIRRLPDDAQLIVQAVDHARKWFFGRRILLVVDNVWPRPDATPGRPEWAPALAPIVECEGSAMLFSTRYSLLTSFGEGSGSKVFHFERLDMNVPVEKQAAAAMLTAYTGSSNTTETTPYHSNGDLSKKNVECAKCMDYLLELCGGWPMALEAAGALIRNMKWQWSSISSVVKRSVAKGRGMHGGRGGLFGIWSESLEFVKRKCSDISGQEAIRLLSVPQGSDEEGLDIEFFRKRDGEDWFQRCVALLSAFDSPKSVSMAVFGVQLGVDTRIAQRVAKLITVMGLGSMEDGTPDRRGQDQKSMLKLHDLQFAFAQFLCANGAVDGLKSVLACQQNFITSCAGRLDGNYDAEVTKNWARMFYEGGFSFPDDSKVYIRRNFAKHLCKCVMLREESDGSMKGATFIIQEGNTWVHLLRSFIVDYRWIRDCSEIRGRSGLLRDWGVLVSSLCTNAENVPSSDDGNRGGCNSVLTVGEQQAVLTIREVLESIPPRIFNAGEKTCQIHGAHDSGLAGQLHGRLTVLRFDSMKKKSERQDALRMRDSLLSSIDAHANGPWLRPIGICYRSSEEKGDRCVMTAHGGDGHMAVLSFIEWAGRRVVVSGCGDGMVRLHDMDRAGISICKTGSVTDIAVSGSLDNGRDGVMFASSSADGTVRIWNIRAPHVKRRGFDDGLIPQESITCVAILRTVSGEVLRCVAMSPDRRRVVAGGYGTSLESGDTRECCVHMWTLASDVLGSEKAPLMHSHVVLGWHTQGVECVTVSTNGTKVFSGSRDGTLRVWRVPFPICGVVEPEDVSLKSAVDVPRLNVVLQCITFSRDASLVLTASSLCGVQIWDVSSGKLIRSLKRDHETKSDVRVSSLALMEDDDEDQVSSEYLNGGVTGMASTNEYLGDNMEVVSGGVARRGRIFCGHSDGTILEWNLEDGSSSTNVYGRAGSLLGTTVALVVQKKSKHSSQYGITNFKDSKRRPPRHFLAPGARKQSRGGNYELVSGHADGQIRVWDTTCRMSDHMKGLNGGEAENLCKGSKHERHVSSKSALVHTNRSHLAQDSVICSASTRDGQMLACGRQSGVVEIWNTHGGDQIRSWGGHQGMVLSVDFDDNGKLFASGSVDGSARVWDVASGRCIRELASHGYPVNFVLFPSNSKHFMTGDGRGIVRVWNLYSIGRAVFTLDATRGGHDIRGLSISVAANEDTPRGWVPGQFKRHFHHRLSPSSEFLVSLDKMGRSRVWRLDARKMKEIAQMPPISKAREKYCRSGHQSQNSFAVIGANLAYSPIMVLDFSHVFGDRLQLRLRSAGSDERRCTCTASIAFDSVISKDSGLVFSHSQDGSSGVLVACGLVNGDVVFASLVS